MNEPSLYAHVVTDDIALECVDAAGIVTTVRVVLAYNPVDPFAVTATFLTAAGDVVWTFARDLLSRGMTAPAGEGDVHIWPSVDARGRTTVIIELCSPDGELVAQAVSQDIHRFVARSLVVVPDGTESDRMDVDKLIAKLLESELD
jgi:hypothetical protein